MLIGMPIFCRQQPKLELNMNEPDIKACPACGKMFKSVARHLYLAYDSDHLNWMIKHGVNVEFTKLVQGNGEMLITRIKIVLGEPN